MPADRTETSIPPAREAPQLPGPLHRSKNIPVLLPTDAFFPSEKDLGRCEQGEDQPAPQSHQARSPRSLESVYTQNPSCLLFQTHLAPLNRDPLIKIRDRPFLAFPFSEKAVKFSKRSQSQSKVCQELSSLDGCSRSPAGGAGCVIQNSLDPGKENRNQAARARGAAEPRRNAAPGVPRLWGSGAAPAPAVLRRPAREELAPAGGNSKPVASGSRAGPWLGPRQPGNRLLSSFLAIQRACSEPQFHFPLSTSQPKRQGTPEAKGVCSKPVATKARTEALQSGTAVWSCCRSPSHLGAGKAEETCLDQP